MSIMLKWPYENTMALGGFATGSRNANEVHSVVGISIKSGFTWIASACQIVKRMREWISEDILTTSNKTNT